MVFNESSTIKLECQNFRYAITPTSSSHSRHDISRNQQIKHRHHKGDDLFIEDPEAGNSRSPEVDESTGVFSSVRSSTNFRSKVVWYKNDKEINIGEDERFDGC